MQLAVPAHSYFVSLVTVSWVQNAKKAESRKREAEARDRQKKVAAVEKQRKKQKGLYLKKTKRGQPVMKHRIDKILGQLQA